MEMLNRRDAMYYKFNKCPVCDGRGVMPGHWFQGCKFCHGTGYLLNCLLKLDYSKIDWDACYRRFGSEQKEMDGKE